MDRVVEHEGTKACNHTYGTQKCMSESVALESRNRQMLGKSCSSKGDLVTNISAVPFDSGGTLCLALGQWQQLRLIRGRINKQRDMPSHVTQPGVPNIERRTCPASHPPSSLE